MMMHDVLVLRVHTAVMTLDILMIRHLGTDPLILLQVFELINQPLTYPGGAPSNLSVYRTIEHYVE
jgi:hypothetical protein